MKRIEVDSTDNIEMRVSTHITTRGKVAAGITTLAVAGGFLGVAAASHEDTPRDTSPVVNCEITVANGDTQSSIADAVGIGQGNYGSVTIYNGMNKLADPASEMQPGDAAVIRVGINSCNEAGGMPGDPTRPGVIVE